MREEQWVTPQHVSEAFGCSVDTVRGMLRDGLLTGEKVAGTWRVTELEVAWLLRPEQPPTPLPKIEPELPDPPTLPPKVESGILEVTIALAGISAAIAALLPSAADAQEHIRLFVVSVATLAGILAFFSAYTALWLLARYCLERQSLVGFEEILALLGSPAEVGPYWFLALGLLVWMILSVLLAVLVVVR